MTFVDSHCHLDKIDENNPDAIANYIANAHSRNVEHMLCVAVNVADLTTCMRKYPPLTTYLCRVEYILATMKTLFQLKLCVRMPNEKRWLQLTKRLGLLSHPRYYCSTKAKFY